MIYITSFNKKLYEATGKKMLKSFEKHNPKDSFTLFTEGDLDLSHHKNIGLVHSLDTEPLLHSWLEENADIIPQVYGGSFTCECNFNKRTPTAGHCKGCPAGEMRRRTCHWYRKIISWQIAKELHSKFTWVDCDTTLRKNMPENIILKYLKVCPVRFHYGAFRKARHNSIESGIVMFDIIGGGGEILDYLKDRFTSGTFRTESRWDDGYMLMIAAKHLDILTKGDLHPNCRINNPMENGPLSIYLTHSKGVHWRNYRVNQE